MRIASLIVLALLAASAGAQTESQHTRALAAGYKAAFLCSGIFNAGQTEAQIAADDLTGIYKEYDGLVAALPATVDRRAGTVAVSFAPDMPPRIAVWRPNLGCAQLPIGASVDAAAALPRLDLQAPAIDAAWPTGDQHATAMLPRGEANAVAKLIERAFDRRSYGEGTETSAVVVLVDGKIAGERYRQGYGRDVPQRTWSVAKSLTATLVGVAVRQGLLDVRKPAPVPEWQRAGDPRARIRLEQLLHMASGLWTDGPGNRTDEIYLGGATVTETAARMPLEAAPGTRFRYANNDTLLAAHAVRAVTGERALAFPFTELLWRIGMTHTTLETDWYGHFVLSSQVWTTARDLARLALLYQNDGAWNGERLLPAGWARYVAMPAPAQPVNAVEGDGPGYGAFFWLYGPRHGLPEGTYAMRGNRGQYVMIVPSRALIVVRRGFDKEGRAPFDVARFTVDLVALLGGRRGG
ncbi:MAG TPA: serine hydrolase [Steroidobacteraceae bacterium]|nr:serine hydrolase [Steroidobacteraceae bacterium]